MAAEPAQQRLVTAVVRGELLVPEQATLVVEGGGVVGVLMGIDAADDDRPWAAGLWCCHAGLRFFREDCSDG